MSQTSSLSISAPSLIVLPDVYARTEIDTLYTPLDEALAQLRERRADEKLRAAVAEFHRPLPPVFLPTEPCAVLYRQIITPNYEFERFITTAQAAGLPPLCLEASEDLFCSRNREKIRWCRPVFEMRPNHLRGLRLPSAGGLAAEGRKLCDLRLANGLTLPAFHRVLLRHVHPGFDRHLCENSQWVFSNAREEFRYLRHLALFICDGVLFENFTTDDEEELRFTRERVLPSFARAIELFGVKPLIVPLLPRESENDEHWFRHPGSLYVTALKISRDQP